MAARAPARKAMAMHQTHTPVLPLLERVATTAPVSGGRLAAIESSASPGFMPPLHAHAADEAVHVLEGSLTVYAGEEIVRLGAGETFVVRQGLAHTYRTGPDGARSVFTTFARSAGRYEDFLRAAGPLSAGGPAWSDEDAASVAAVAAAAHVVVLGPPGVLPTDVDPAVHAA
jgi:quercetin dioxygenase-like cupin family protein